MSSSGPVFGAAAPEIIARSVQQSFCTRYTSGKRHITRLSIPPAGAHANITNEDSDGQQALARQPCGITPISSSSPSRNVAGGNSGMPHSHDGGRATAQCESRQRMPARGAIWARATQDALQPFPQSLPAELGSTSCVYFLPF